MGFEYSSECFVKGDKMIAILSEIAISQDKQDEKKEQKVKDNFQLVTIFEMEPIKTELFDCEQFMITIDDLIVQLTDALRYEEGYEDYE